ncbi:helix-turn-helix domain-containing protein, partial [Aquirufa aurantiipilula]|uniref:helix-turn-helix domain-containing protein n=1 Tax=Aquirufa aurantiipilula TaxID=2696561 RepID=UPI001CAA74A3
LSCVKAVVELHQPILYVRGKYNVPKTLLTRWLTVYRQVGLIGLQSKKNHVFSASFKLKVLQAIDKYGLSLAQACIDFSIGSEASIINWQRQWKKFGLEGLVNKPKGRQVMDKLSSPRKLKFKHPLTREQELLLELESLRAKNAYLKKLQALIQAEEANKRKPFKN